MPFVESSLNPGMDYTQGWFRMTCILYEGTVTVTKGSKYTQEGEIVEAVASVASPISKENIVEIHNNAGNTAVATGGVPVVQAVSGANPAFGIVASNPKWVKVPQTAGTYSTWATNLSKDYYRVAEVWIPAQRAFEAETTLAASTSVAPGNSLIYDNSADGWVYGRAGLSFDNSAVWDKSGADTGANGFLCEPISCHKATTNTQSVLALHGLIPLPTQA